MAKIWNEGVLELEEEEQSIEMKSCKDKKEDLFFGDMEKTDPIDQQKFPHREKRSSEGIVNYNYKRGSTGNSGVNKSVNNENMIQRGGVGNQEAQTKNPGAGSQTTSYIKEKDFDAKKQRDIVTIDENYNPEDKDPNPENMQAERDRGKLLKSSTGGEGGNPGSPGLKNNSNGGARRGSKPSAGKDHSSLGQLPGKPQQTFSPGKNETINWDDENFYRESQYSVRANDHKPSPNKKNPARANPNAHKVNSKTHSIKITEQTIENSPHEVHEVHEPNGDQKNSLQVTKDKDSSLRPDFNGTVENQDDTEKNTNKGQHESNLSVRGILKRKHEEDWPFNEKIDRRSNLYEGSIVSGGKKGARDSVDRKPLENVYESMEENVKAKGVKFAEEPVVREVEKFKDKTNKDKASTCICKIF